MEKNFINITNYDNIGSPIFYLDFCQIKNNNVTYFNLIKKILNKSNKELNNLFKNNGIKLNNSKLKDNFKYIDVNDLMKHSYFKNPVIQLDIGKERLIFLIK